MVRWLESVCGLQAFGLEAAGAASTLRRLLQAWTLNCFESSEAPTAYAIYFVPSFMSHSCAPSAVWALTEDQRFRLRARCDIEEGAEVSISYLSEEMLLDTAPERQGFLLASKGFWCSCDRCAPSAPDLSRGFRCPAEGCDGVIFCRVPGAAELGHEGRRGRARPSRSRSRSHRAEAAAEKALAGAECPRCGLKARRAEARALLREERWLRAKLAKWEARSPRGSLTAEAAAALVERVQRGFAQHVAADHALGHLAAAHAGLGLIAEAARLVGLRAEFHKLAYPCGPSGAYAWTLEAQAAMLLDSRGVDAHALLRRPQPLAALRPLLNGELARGVAAEVVPLYAAALEVLGVLFGADHEYYLEVAVKAQGPERNIILCLCY